MGLQGRVLQARSASGIDHFGPQSTDQDSALVTPLQGRLGQIFSPCTQEDKETGFGEHTADSDPAANNF